ncbi:MAG: ATP synthase F1 subunit delta [Bacteroidota bacterium]|nr:ATP synthase F1 subunit delta [Bacteroidota bacterium]
MNLSKISVRYARALFAVARDQNLLDQVHADMEMLGHASEEVPAFRSFLENPVMIPSAKKKLLHNMFEGNVSKLTIDFLNLILKNNRLSFISGISRQFGDQYREFNGITSAILTTATEIGESTKDRIKQLVLIDTKNEVLFEGKRDDEIIGGFILQVDDKQIDASVRTQLNKIKKELTRKVVTAS